MLTCLVWRWRRSIRGYPLSCPIPPFTTSRNGARWLMMSAGNSTLALYLLHGGPGPQSSSDWQRIRSPLTIACLPCPSTWAIHVRPALCGVNAPISSAADAVPLVRGPKIEFELEWAGPNYSYTTGAVEAVYVRSGLDIAYGVTNPTLSSCTRIGTWPSRCSTVCRLPRVPYRRAF